MINWSLIDEEELAALVKYAHLCGFEPEMFARAKLDALRAANTRFNRAQNSIGGVGIALKLDEDVSAISALIALGRRAAKQRVLELSRLATDHVGRYHLLYGIDLDTLKTKAELVGIDTKQPEWLERFLQEIPILTPFSPNLDAFVSLFPDKSPRIVVSANLHDVFEIALIPLILNVISEDGRAFPLARRRFTSNLVEKAADVILATASTYLHKDVGALNRYLDSQSQDSWLLRHTEVVDTIGALMVFGAIDFVYLHELAHVVLGHEGNHPKRDEIEADNLAMNCLFQAYRQSQRDDLLDGFLAAGVAIMFYFFEFLDAFNGPYLSDSHPPVVFRRAALSLATLGVMGEAPLTNYRGLIQTCHAIFLAAFARKKSGICSPNESIMSELEGSRLVTIPSSGAPFVQVLRKHSA